MSPIMRSWLAFAAVGTGLIHLALVVSSPPLFGLLLAIVGVTELAWGVWMMASTRLVAPRAALAGAVVPIVLWGLVLFVAVSAGLPEIAQPLRFLPLAIAAVFELFAAGVLAVHTRRAIRRPGTNVPPATPPAGRYLLGMLVGSLVVAGLVTPALAATAAGEFAQPHGTHSGVVGDGVVGDGITGTQHGDH